MQTSDDLRELLRRIDHRGYPAYKDTKGVYRFPGYLLSIDHVQGDPFASPSKISVHVKGNVAGFPKEYFTGKCQRRALQDYLTRQFGRTLQQYTFEAKGSGKSGLMSVSRCGQEVLERTACEINAVTGDVILRLEVGFPANGRTINARELEKILFVFLPECIQNSLYYKNNNQTKVRNVIELAEDQEYIRGQLKALGLVAFVANGSVLPRESGISSRPMKGGIAFQSPKSMEVTMQLPHKGIISGMGIRRGITLIVGGGYHGKSTLLKALELGVYDHIEGDGREYVITDDTALKIRAEDGRSIRKTDISMFINDLPNGKDTRQFYTEDASGSTSQAANVIEGMEAGAKTLLIDEDTSATNFMIRDELMQRVIHRDMEPITPFIERIRELYENYGVSTVIVAGSSGAFFRLADTIVQMDRYLPKDITVAAKKEAEAYYAQESYGKDSRSQAAVKSAGEMSGKTESCPKAQTPEFDRRPKADKAFRANERIKMKTLGCEAVQINRESIDLRYVEQLVDSEQVTALGYCIRYAQMHYFNGKTNLSEAVAKLEKQIEQDGLAGLCESSSNVSSLAMPRTQEIFACFNRFRGLLL